MMSPILRAFVCVALLSGLLVQGLAATPARAATPTYTLIDLGASNTYDPNDPSCPVLARGAEAISSNGIVVGQLLKGDRIVPAATEAGSDELAALSSGSAGGAARGVNASGVVVGNLNAKSGTPACGDFRLSVTPVMWTNGQRSKLPLGDRPYGRADKINDKGDVIGWVSDDEGNQRPAAWRGGKLVELPCLHDDDIGGGALGINSDGAIVGSCFSIDQLSHQAFDHAIVWKGDTVTTLDEMDGSSSFATAINDAGQITGAILSQDSNGSYQMTAAIWTDGKPTALPGIDDTYGAFGDAINAHGDVAGQAQTADGYLAVVWLGGKAMLVSDLAGNPDGWAFWAAKAIGDDGTIVGLGLVNGEIHGYILRPAA